MARKQNKTPAKSSYSTINTKKGGKITKKPKTNGGQTKTISDNKAQCVKCSKFLSRLDKSKGNMCKLCLQKEAYILKKERDKDTNTLVSKVSRKNLKSNDNVKKSTSKSSPVISPSSSKNSTASKKRSTQPVQSTSLKQNTRGSNKNSGNSKSKKLENNLKIEKKVSELSVKNQSAKNVGLRGKKRSLSQIDNTQNIEAPTKKTKISNQVDNLRGTRNKKPTVKGSEWLSTINLKKTTGSQKDPVKSKATRKSPKSKSSPAKKDKSISPKVSEMKTTKARSSSVAKRESGATKVIPKRQVKKKVSIANQSKPSNATRRTLKRKNDPLNQKAKSDQSLQPDDPKQTSEPNLEQSKSRRLPLKDNLSKSIRKKFSSCFTDKNKEKVSGLNENVQVVKEILHDILSDVTFKCNSKNNTGDDMIIQELDDVEKVETGCKEENLTTVNIVETEGSNHTREFSDGQSKEIATQSNHSKQDIHISSDLIGLPNHENKNECNSNDTVADDCDIHTKNCTKTTLDDNITLTSIKREINNDMSFSCDDSSWKKAHLESSFNESVLKIGPDSADIIVSKSEELQDNSLDNIKSSTDIINTSVEKAIDDAAVHLEKNNEISEEEKECRSDSNLESSITCTTKNVVSLSMGCESHDPKETNIIETNGSPHKHAHEMMNTIEDNKPIPVQSNVKHTNTLTAESKLDEYDRLHVEENRTESSIYKINDGQKPRILVDGNHANNVENYKNNDSLQKHLDKNGDCKVKTLIVCEDNLKKEHENVAVESNVFSVMGSHKIPSKDCDINTKCKNIECLDDIRTVMECDGNAFKEHNDDTHLTDSKLSKSVECRVKELFGKKEIDNTGDTISKECNGSSLGEFDDKLLVEPIDELRTKSNECHPLSNECHNKNGDIDDSNQIAGIEDNERMECDVTLGDEENSSSIENTLNPVHVKCSIIKPDDAKSDLPDENEEKKDSKPTEYNDNTFSDSSHSEQVVTSDTKSNTCSLNQEPFDNEEKEIKEDSSSRECDDYSDSIKEQGDEPPSEEICVIDSTQNQHKTPRESFNEINKLSDNSNRTADNENSEPTECDSTLTEPKDDTLIEQIENKSNDIKIGEDSKQQEEVDCNTPGFCDDNLLIENIDDTKSEHNVACDSPIEREEDDHIQDKTCSKQNKENTSKIGGVGLSEQQDYTMEDENNDGLSTVCNENINKDEKSFSQTELVPSAQIDNTGNSFCLMQIKENDDDLQEFNMKTNVDCDSVHAPKDVLNVNSMETETDLKNCLKEPEKENIFKKESENRLLSHDSEGLSDKPRLLIQETPDAFPENTQENYSESMHEDDKINNVLSDTIYDNLTDSNVINPTEEESDHGIQPIRQDKEDRTIEENGSKLSINIEESYPNSTPLAAGDCCPTDDDIKTLNFNNCDDNSKLDSNSMKTKIDSVPKNVPSIDKPEDNSTCYEMKTCTDAVKQNEEPINSENELTVESSKYVNRPDEINSAINNEKDDRLSKEHPSKTMIVQDESIDESNKMEVLSNDNNEISITEENVLELSGLEEHSKKAEFAQKISSVPTLPDDVPTGSINDSSKFVNDVDEAQFENEISEVDSKEVKPHRESSSKEDEEKIDYAPSIATNKVPNSDLSTLDKLPLDGQEKNVESLGNMEVDNVDDKDNKSNVFEVYDSSLKLENQKSKHIACDSDDVNSQACHETSPRKDSPEVSNITAMDVDTANETASEHSNTVHLENTQTDLEMECS